jgi:hypothetical protein
MSKFMTALIAVTSKTNQNLDIEFSAEIYNESLIMIEDICILISNSRAGC